MQNIHRRMKLTVLFSVAFCFFSFASLANFADPEIAANNTTLCEGANIELKLKNLTAGDAYQWVKDGNNLDSTREALIVSTPGVYKLKVTNNGNTITSNTITINPKPYVNFSYSATDVCPNTPIDFKYILSDGSQGTEGSGFTYSWDYKDGDKENKFNPTHTFKVTAGSGSQNFDVQFTIKDNNGCTNQTTKTISIKQKPDATLNGTGKDVINSESYFKICSSTGTSFQFTNPSTTKAKNTSYTFIWGDNSSDYTTTSFDAIVTHSYSVGLKTMIYRVYNGACYDEKTYKIFVGNIPAGGISGIGGSTICAGDAQKFLITNSTDNPAGTSYTLSYGDGKPDVVFYHPAPDTVKNIFLKSSCGNVLTSGSKTYKNAFGAFLEISNPCGSASGSILPIYVSDKPDPQIGLSDSIICVNQTVNIANTGYVGKNVQNDKCTAGNLYWGILGDRLGTSYNITTGVTGDGFGSGDPSLWSSGTNNLSVQFATLGKYDVSLTMANNTLCGSATTKKTICVNPLPTASFTTDATEGCAPFTVTANGSTNDITCGQNRFEWSVTYKATADCDPKTAAYSFVNNTDKNSQNPQIKFDNPGVYTLELITIAPGNKCTSSVVTKVVTVKSKPNVAIDALADACQAATVNPKATISCNTTNATYNWTATGGTFLGGTTSTSINPQISFTSFGNYTVQLAITNSCGTTTASKDIKIKPTPSLTKPNDVVVCANSTVNTINFTSNVANTIFNWTNNNTTIGLAGSGAGNIASFTGLNATTTAKVATITVTPVYNGCSGVAQTFTIAVNPLPVLSDPSTSICIGTSATLNVSGADTYTWTPATGLSATTGASVTANPTTTTTYTIQGTTTATGCSSTKNITVTVANAPVINVNDATICLGNSVTLNATGANTFSWTPATGLSTTAGASVTANPTTTTTYTVTGSSGAGCTASKNVTVTVNPNPVITIPDGVICKGANISLIASGADTYVWTPAIGLSATTGTTVTASPTATQTYTVTGTKTATGCSSTGKTTVTVNPNPTVTVNSGSVCPGFSLPLTATGADSYNWTNNTTTLSATTGANVTASPTATTTYTVRGTNTTTSCYSDATSTVTVNEVPSIDATFTNPLTCGGASGTITISGFRANASYEIYYEKDGVAKIVTATANATGKIILNNLTKGVYDKIEARLTGCISNKIGAYTLEDPNAPATPTLTNTGPICSGNNFTLNTTYAQTNATYTWTGPNGFNITTTTNSTTLNSATVAAAGVYKLYVTLANCNSPEISTTVVINQTPDAPIVTSPVVYCQRATAVALTATTGTGNSLQWYTTATGGTASTTAPTPLTGTNGNVYYYVSQKTVAGCEGPRATILVTTSPVPNINATTSNPTTCLGTEGYINITGFERSLAYTINYKKNGTLQTVTLTSNTAGEIKIANLTKGDYSDIQVVLNGGCFSNIIGPYTLKDPEAPQTPSMGNNGPICSGNNLTLNTTFNQTSTIYIWSGPNGFNTTSTTNSTTLNNATVVATGTYKLIVKVANCNSPEATTDVTINQTPDAPTVTSPLIYCQRATPSALNATAAIGNSLQWYTIATGGVASTTAPTPSTATNGDVYYYVSQKTAVGCEGPRARILVTTKTVPNIDARSFNPTTCSGTEGYLNITGFEPSSSYTINYKKDGTSQTATLSSNTTGVIQLGNLKAGTYTDIQVALNGCLSNIIGPFSLSDPAPPALPILSNDGPICSGNNLTLSTTFNQPSTTYIWTGPNGFNTNTNTNSTSLTNATVTATGTYKLIVKVANCNSPEASTEVTINPTPLAPTVTSPITYCQYASSSALNATAVNNNTLQWYTTATGGTASTTAPTPSTAINGSVYYYVSQKTALGCEGPRATILVTTKPIPRISATSTNPTTCNGSEGTITITGFEPNSPYTIIYKKNDTLKTTSLTSNVTGVIRLTSLTAANYTDIQAVLDGCYSNSIGAFLLVDPIPPFAPVLNDAGPFCTTTNLIINTTNPINGAIYTWTGPNGFTQTGTNSSINIPNAIMNAAGLYLVFVSQNNCNSPVSSKTIVINPTPSLPLVVSPVIYCQNDQATPLTANGETGNQLIWYTDTTLAGSLTAPIPITTAKNTVYYFVSQKTPAPAGCESRKAIIQVTVNSTPSIQNQSLTICSNDTINLNIPGVLNGTQFKWDLPQITPAGSIIGFTDQQTHLATIGQRLVNTTPAVGNVKYIISPKIGNCPGPNFEMNVTVNPVPMVANIAQPAICSGTQINLTPTTAVAGNNIPTGTTYKWNIQSIIPAGSLTGATTQTIAQASFIQSLTNITNQQSKIIYTVTPISGNCEGKSFEVSVLVDPTPKIQDATATICSENSFDLTPLNAEPGTIVPANTLYTWPNPISTFITGASAETIGKANISQMLVNNTTVAQNITYIITPKAGNCAAPPFKMVVTVNPKPTITPKEVTVCSGTAFDIVPAEAPIGTQYIWKSPTILPLGTITGGSAQTIPQNSIGQLLTNLTNAPAKATYIVSPASGNCGGSGFNVVVTVNPKPFIPTLYDTICTEGTFKINPVNGVNGSIVPDLSTYTWTLPASLPIGVVTGGSLLNVGVGTIGQKLFNTTDAPGTLRYTVSPISGASGNCAGEPFTVNVFVNPNAKAKYNPTDTMGCPPYLITPTKVNLTTYPGRNQDYLWYIDDVFHGSGLNLPKFTIPNEDDTVILKLVTPSLVGCKSDSIKYHFITYKLPHPKFSVSDSVGCGPLKVKFTNQTNDITFFTYDWDFGNGIKSNKPQPDDVIFFSNPNYGDTVYTVTLKVTSFCNVVEYRLRIRVKSKPKAIFSPSRTIGCSPLKVSFNNTSKGLGNRYVWDFGDGQKDSTLSRDSMVHVFSTKERDTFYVKLYAINECGVDSSVYNVIVSPNTIKLDVAVNGNQKEGCLPLTVQFINNSSGVSSFQWDFGDGNIRSTNKNLDTIVHTYLSAGKYQMVLLANNGCTDTSTVEEINVFGIPKPDFATNTYKACVGDSIFFTNQSKGADAYFWDFGDGKNSKFVNPGYGYTKSGFYTVKLIAYKTNTPGSVCFDTLKRFVQIVDTVQINYTASDTIANCTPVDITFSHNYRKNFNSTWNFGDGTIQEGDSIVHTYTKTGTYLASLLVKGIGGCNYIGNKTIAIIAPIGNVFYNSGYNCIKNAVRFEAKPLATDSIRWEFGDGSILTTTDWVVYHNYTKPGKFLPKIYFKSKLGCSYLVPLKDTVIIDKIVNGFTFLSEAICGSTKIDFKDTSNSFYGLASIQWDFGDASTGIKFNETHIYTSSNNYTIQTIVTGKSGCSDTVIKTLPIFVKSKPLAQIVGDTSACTGKEMTLKSFVISPDSLTLLKWTVSNGDIVYGSTFKNTYSKQTNLQYTFVAGTKYGCFDTAKTALNVYITPIVKAAPDVTICRGNTIAISATGATFYNWYPTQGLSCTNCSNPDATPLQTTPYTVKGSSPNGCFSYDTITVKVIPNFKIQVSPDDSICIGQSKQLIVSGAKHFEWSPSTWLSSDTASNPLSKPDKTIRYRVIGSDEFNCFRDTAYVLVGVGNYPTIDLGPDQLLSTGTLFPLKSTYTEGPIKTWSWSPSTYLNCTTCPIPIADIHRKITYYVKATNYFGCSATDSIHIESFCTDAQVYIPNAFTPDNDGLNDIFMVRATGIQTVKSFKIFNRWGGLVFDKANFNPNDPKFGWDGKINGVVPQPDVFVYIAEVICENGSAYSYKGNVTLLK